MDKSSKAELDKTYLIFPYDLLHTPGLLKLLLSWDFFCNQVVDSLGRTKNLVLEV